MLNWVISKQTYLYSIALFTRFGGFCQWRLWENCLAASLVFCHFVRYIDFMSTIQITLPESLQRFVVKQVAELGLDQPDQYFEQLLEEERRRKQDEYYMEKCQEAIDADRWTQVTDENRQEFWDRIRQKAKQLRDARSLESAILVPYLQNVGTDYTFRSRAG